MKVSLRIFHRLSLEGRTKPQFTGSFLQQQKLKEMAESGREQIIDGIKIKVDKNVYPLGSDSYLFAEAVKIKQGQTALDLCTGTGVIAFILAKKGASKVVGVDLNPRSISNAEENKKHLGLSNIDFIKSDLFEAVQEKFDVITINPPYTDAEPSNDIDICFFDPGHKTVRRFFSEVGAHLTPGGVAYIAWSNIGPMDLLPELATDNNLTIRRVKKVAGGKGFIFYVYSLRPKG